MTKLTKHVRHARLVKLVRRTYQSENPGARLWPNTSGAAWQGVAINGADEVVLKHPRPIKFGIPEPGPLGTDQDGSGGADLLGETQVDNLPILTAIECKTGKSRLKKNQIRFRDWVLSVNGIHHVARECPECWERWIPFKENGKIVYWIPEKECPVCHGRGYVYG